MRVLALDYGRVSTGAAVSDPTGTVVRPLDEIGHAAAEAGISRIRKLVQAERAELVIVGMPLSLNGEAGAQARETAELLKVLAESLDPIPTISWDERFTSKIAAVKGRGSDASEHSLAACCLLEDYLGSAEHARRSGSTGEAGDPGDERGE